MVYLPRDARRRFIPARAGNTKCALPLGQGRAVHPRSRGKYMQGMVEATKGAGSSPLAREIPVAAPVDITAWRFIPARAGNTYRPKARNNLAYGSSPLAREIPARRAAGDVPNRFIPARAGNTMACRLFGAFSAVHPRSRGKYGFQLPHLGAHPGSSPLAREIHFKTAREHVSCRFIPARAGNTLVGRRKRRAQVRFIPARAGNTYSPL